MYFAGRIEFDEDGLVVLLVYKFSVMAVQVEAPGRTQEDFLAFAGVLQKLHVRIAQEFFNAFFTHSDLKLWKRFDNPLLP